jgi:hypothetical protein
MVHRRFRAQISRVGLFLPFPDENTRIDQEVAGPGPGSKGLLFPRPDDPILPGSFNHLYRLVVEHLKRDPLSDDA